MDQRLCLPVWLACISSFHHLHSHCWGVLVSSFTTVDRLWLPQFCISLLCHCRRSWSSSVRLVVWMSCLPSCSHCHAELMSWDKFKCHFSRLPLDPPPPPRRKLQSSFLNHPFFPQSSALPPHHQAIVFFLPRGFLQLLVTTNFYSPSTSSLLFGSILSNVGNRTKSLSKADTDVELLATGKIISGHQCLQGRGSSRISFLPNPALACSRKGLADR